MKFASSENNKSIHPSEYYLGKKEVKPSNKGRVDINTLILKVREKELKEKKENLVLISLVSSVVILTGIIASF